jgi:hypothetical protein
VLISLNHIVAAIYPIVTILAAKHVHGEAREWRTLVHDRVAYGSFHEMVIDTHGSSTAAALNSTDRPSSIAPFAASVDSI